MICFDFFIAERFWLCKSYIHCDWINGLFHKIYDSICDRTIAGGGRFGETKDCGRKTMMSHQLLCLHNVYNVPLRTMYCTHCLHNVQNMYIVQCVVCTMCTMSAIALEHYCFDVVFIDIVLGKAFHHVSCLQTIRWWWWFLKEIFVLWVEEDWRARLRKDDIASLSKVHLTLQHYKVKYDNVWWSFC